MRVCLRTIGTYFFIIITIYFIRPLRRFNVGNNPLTIENFVCLKYKGKEVKTRLTPLQNREAKIVSASELYGAPNSRGIPGEIA